MAQYAPQGCTFSEEQEYLQAYEDVLEKYKDERDRVQKKTFTKWINQHLMKVRKHINDLYEDLRDGHNLISLLEVLSGDTLPRERGRMRFHKLQNVQIALDYLKRRQVKLVNIRNDDITDGNPKLTLGLIWTIILHFQISEIHVTGESEDMTAKERLLFWSKQMTEGYVGVRCDNFTTSWRDGKLFNAIIHKYRPDLVDMSHISAQTNRSNLEQAFCVAEQLGVARLLDPEDVDVQSPDEKSVITYVSTLYDAFPKVPDGVDGISPNDVDIKWVEYQNMIKYLSQWIKHNVAIMNDRAFPNSPAELKALYSQYLQFKDYEIPIKEIEKTKIQNLYQMLEVWIEFGRIQLPPGHHPNDMEKEWGKLIVAMLEREKSLRPELERLEMLQQIANRIQRDCVNGEERLSLAKASLQSDTKRLESGIQVLNEAEVASNLLECENILRQQVVDIQILLDGKFPFADQLVQRISKLRDDLLVLRAECLSVYSRGHTLTSEQAKMMISGITQSLNSGFSPNMSSSSLSAGLSAGGMVTPGSAYTSSLSPCLSPAHPPVMSPGLQSSMQTFMSGGGGSLDADGFRHVKQMQIRKPLMKSSLADPTMSEDEVNMKYVQDLLTWVEEMQLQLDRAEWGSDLPSVETSLDNHRSIHRAIEDFQTSLKEAKLGEIQMTSQTKLNYSEKLNRLDKQYDRLLSSSRDRQSHLENLHDFVSKATQELIWLNEKEEEEVAFDWSDRNSNISKKRDYHADLMRELDDKDDAIKSVQDKADRLLLKNHPARLTIEAYRAAMQTQWSWILQLCACVEQHLKENAVYFEFFSDAKESMDYLKSLQDTIHRKYSCDRTSSLHRLDDLIQESMDEKEQLLQYRSTVAGLVGRAKSIVQLRPRNPDNPVRSSIPVKAICDYRQIEITIYKEDECVLASNSHRAKWKVINPAGNEAMVPSVCFTVPPPNKEAVDMATKTEQLYQNVLSLWHHSHINMSSVVAWHRLMADIRAIHNWNVSSIKTMLPGEHQQVIHNLQVHFDEFLKDSKESEVFTVADCAQLDRDVAVCKEYYEELLRSAEREEHQESAYNHYISDIRNFRMHLESHEEHLIRQIRTPLERDDLDQSLLRITEHEKKIVELSKLKEDFDVMKDKCEVFIRQAVGSTSASTLSSELTALGHSMNQVHSMAFIYLDKLKTVSLVVKHSQSAEMLIKSYESKLYEEDAMNSDLKSIEAVVTTLKQWRTEIDEQQEVFHDMEDELQKARVIGDRMFKAHNERDFDLDWHKEKADQLSERWQSVHSQIDSRLRDLDGINKSLKHYKESYGSLDEWIQEMEATQLKAQENKPEDSKALAELLNKQKVLVGEIEQIQGRIDECQKYSEQYSTSVKDYELQLMTFRAVVDSQHKSPLKKRRMQSSADAIQQEFMDLRTRYTALVTLMTQYVKFASETLKRTEEEERSVDEEKREHGDKVSKLLHWMSNVKHSINQDGSVTDSNANTGSSKRPQVSMEDLVTKKEQIAEAMRITEAKLNKHSEKMTDEEREEAKEQLKELNQAYSDLSQHCESNTSSADEVFTSGLNGFLVKSEILSQSPIQDKNCTVMCKYMDQHQDPRFKSTVNDPNKCLQSADLSSVYVSEVAAALGESTRENAIIKMVELQNKNEGLQMCYTGHSQSLDGALHSGVIPASLFIKAIQQQKQCSENTVPDSEPHEVNSMILNCLKGNKSIVPERNILSLKSSSQGQHFEQEHSQPQDNIKPHVRELQVDASVQCDLMSSSSTLIVLGNQFVGVVLPQNVSTSLRVEKEAIFSSRLFGDYQKIVALYIPEMSEVLDIDLAVHKGYIDSFAADILKTISIPDELLDIDKLNKEYSSWLTYIRLRSEGQLAPLQLHFKIPSPYEAKRLFISYLKINSYIDPKSGQRILIMDKQLTNIIKIFLENPAIYDNVKEGNYSVGPADLSNVPLEIKEDEEDGEEPIYTESEYFVSSANGNISFNENERESDFISGWADFNNQTVSDEAEIVDLESYLEFEKINLLPNQFVQKTEIQTIETVICTMSCSPQIVASSESYIDADYTSRVDPHLIESHFEEREIEETIYLQQGTDREENTLNMVTEETYGLDTATTNSLFSKPDFQGDSSVDNIQGSHENTTLTWNNDFDPHKQTSSLISNHIHNISDSRGYEKDTCIAPKESIYIEAGHTTPFDPNYLSTKEPCKKTAAMTLEITHQNECRESQGSAALMEHEARKSKAEISGNLYSATPCISDPDSACSPVMSPLPGNHVTAQSTYQIDKTQVEGSLLGITRQCQANLDPTVQMTSINALAEQNGKPLSTSPDIHRHVSVDQATMDKTSSGKMLCFENLTMGNEVNSAESPFHFDLTQDDSSLGGLVQNNISGKSFDKNDPSQNIVHQYAKLSPCSDFTESEVQTKQLRVSSDDSSANLSETFENENSGIVSMTSSITDEDTLVKGIVEMNIVGISPDEQEMHMSKNGSIKQTFSNIENEADLVNIAISGDVYGNEKAVESTRHHLAVTYSRETDIDSDSEMLRNPTPDISRPNPKETKENVENHTFNIDISSVYAKEENTSIDIKRQSGNDQVLLSVKDGKMDSAQQPLSKCQVGAELKFENAVFEQLLDTLQPTGLTQKVPILESESNLNNSKQHEEADAPNIQLLLLDTDPASENAEVPISMLSVREQEQDILNLNVDSAQQPLSNCKGEMDLKILKIDSGKDTASPQEQVQFIQDHNVDFDGEEVVKEGSMQSSLETPHCEIERPKTKELLQEHLETQQPRGLAQKVPILEPECNSNDHEHSEEANAPNIQLQLLQILKTVSGSGDLSVLQEVMDTLNSALGGETAPVTRHRLDSIKEEEEAEGDLDLPVEDSTVSGKDKDTSKIKEVQNMLFSIQDYLECVGKLQDHADVLEDIQKDLCCPTPGNMEELQSQMVECQTLKTQLSELAEVLTVDMKKAKQLLNSAAVEIPKQIHQDLASTYLDLEPQFIAVCKMCAERSNSLNDAIQAGKGHLESAFVQHVNTLQELADCCKCDSEASAMDLNVCDINRLIFLIQQNKDLENSLRKNGRQKLEDVTFDIQSFLSEHAQFLSPAHSSCLLKLLSSTQRAFKEQTERLAAERSSMELLVEQKQMQNQAQTILEKHKEFSEKLEELFDDLTLTENRLIGHQQQAENTESLSELQQYQQEHQALQKDVMTNASALNEVVSSTKKYLEENRSKLSPAQVAEIENKLEDATSKSKVINQRVEDSRKDLEKVVTSAIKQESEKAAAVERLEESKNKIEGLLDWISNIGHDNKSSPDETDHMSNTNGNPPGEISAKELMDEDANGNAPRSPGQDHSRENGQSSASADLDKQYAKVKAHHQNILSQQQDLLIATQSAQTLLDKQANVLSPEEKERLQKNIHELKGRYETSLTQAEQQMKQLQCVQEELKTFQDDCQEFEGWLDQAEDEMQKLETPAGSLNILTDKLLYQRNFSEDVISHKGDLRFITISGQKVLDVAQACGVANAADKNTHVPLDTSGASALVKNKLDSAATRYKALHSQCNQLGNNIKDVIDKYKKYNDSTAGLLKWLNNSEDEARKQQSEAIAADPQTLQKQLEDNKVLQNQTTGHQAAVDTLSKTAESLISSEGDLLSNTDEIQETVDDIVERYDNLSKSVSDRNEKIQITLTRSMSVQDGLDEMLGWMQRVEASVKEDIQVPLDSVSMASALSKENALEQDMASRQGSISAIKAKVKKFAETADPSAAAQLQFNMEALSQRFSNACDQQKQKVSTLEQLKKKVEDFEKVSEKVQQFVMRRSQELHETDGPSKTFTELSGLMQNTKAEMEEHARDLEKLQSLSKELCELSTDGNKIQIQSKMENLTNTFNSFKDTVQEKEEEVSSCRDQLEEFRALSSSLTSWLEQTKDKVPAVDPSRSEKCLEKDLQIVTGLMDEWTSKTPIVQDMNSKGSTLCSFITFLTSPAKSKNSNKADLMVIQQKMSFVNEEYKNLGDSLKSRAADIGNLVHEVKRAQKETADMMAWLKDMKKTAASWKVAATENDSVKTQLENQKIVEDNMKQKTEEMQELREKLLHLIQTHPNTPEAAKWKQMLSEIDAAWADISDSVVERKQHLEQSNKNLDIFKTSEQQLCQWLSEKEMLMSVLGPLSIDPNMLKMQKQQVQIIQNEFKSRAPQYEQLQKAASALLSSTQEPQNGKIVEAQLAVVTQKWQNLSGQLDSRDSLIDQAVVKTRQFQQLLTKLSDTTTELEKQITNQHSQSTLPDAVKKHLEVVQKICTQLREEKKKVKEAEDLCSELKALVTEDYLRADLTRQLEAVTKPFSQLEEKAAKCVDELSSTFASSQQFHQTSKDFQLWLSKKLLKESKFISAKVEVLQQTLEDQNKQQQTFAEHERDYVTILAEGERLLQSVDGAEKLALQGLLTKMSRDWEDVKNNHTEQTEKLQTALQKSLKFHENTDKLNSWIQETENREASVKLSVDPVEVENSISQVKALQKDVEKHRGLVEQLNTAAEGLMEVANADTELIKEEKSSIDKRVESVVEALQNRKDTLEQISHKVKEFNDDCKEAQSHLEAAKKQMETYESQGVQAHSNKNLANMKAQHKSLNGVENQIDHLKSLAKDLVVAIPDVDGVTDLLLQSDSIEKEYCTLNKKLEETCQVLEGKLQGIGQFQNNIREMFTRFTDLDDELDNMAPVDLDLDKLKDQETSVVGFISRLQELMSHTSDAGESCKKMLETEDSSDLIGLKRDLETLSKQCGKLLDRAKSRNTQVQNTLQNLEVLYEKVKEVESKLDKAVAKDTSQDPVGMDPGWINQQLESFKTFQKEDIDPLHKQLQEINSLGQSLAQSATKGTCTKKLEGDLEDVNTKWNTLNKKIAERSAQLHESLLHCGRFQDALESLLSWLTDTEELVANQKSPSAEFKVVKAQIQEQKLLQRLLDDRKPTVELIKKEGGKLSELTEAAEKEKVAKEIECLGQRWDSLLKKAENRKKQLESILVVTQQFHEMLEPLSEWLCTTEKVLSHSDPIGTETCKLKEQISQHKTLEEEIMKHSKDLFQAVNLGQMLRTVCSIEDKEFVQNKLDTAQSGYIELQERCRRKAELLQQALSNAQLFGEDEVALMNWLSEVHATLSEVSVEDYRTDTLEKQLKDQWTLQSDIELRKKDVDRTIFSGMELLKQTTGDEVVVIQSKLDGIKNKYTEINTMSDNVLKTLEKVLGLSTQLHQTHEDLNNWLETVEAEVNAFAVNDAAGVNGQLVDIQNRKKDLLQVTKNHKPVVDKLNELSGSLLDLIPWHTRESLDKLVTEDNDRFKSVYENINQQVDQINSDILQSQQFEQLADTELAWLTEAERKLLCVDEIKLTQDQTTSQLQAQKMFSMDIMRHKDTVDGIVRTGKAVMNNRNPEGKETIQAKTQALLEKYGTVSQMNSERCLQLERAQSLAAQFWETFDEMWPWLQETLKVFTQLSPPAIEYEALKQQQEELRQMRELIAEHKPHIDKMNKTGPQMLELSPGEGVPIQEKYTTADQLYTQLKADVKQRAATLDEAISKSTQFHDKIDPMLESLERIAERLRQPPSISVEVDKIKEQIAENKSVSVDLEKLQPSYDTLKQRGEEMVARSEGADTFTSAKVVQDKLDKMVFLWSDIQALVEEREAKLLDVMDLADKFWCDHCALIVTIKDSQDLLKELEEPGVDPSVVKQQQEFVDGFKEEIDGLMEELEAVQNQGADLMAACGEPDKPVIKKSLDEVASAWETLNKTWRERGDRLEEAMQAAVQFQDGLQGMFDWVDILESKLDSMSPVGTDLETVKQQIVEHKEFKGEAYQLQIEMERLNHQAGLLLKKATEDADRCAIQEPMSELKMLWENFEEKIISRQHKLEAGLLALGQFQHALDELLAWMSHTEELLNEQRKTGGDPKAMEIELAKHHVLQIDVLAHQTTVETVNKAGYDLVASSAGEEASSLQNKLESLNLRWKVILEKTDQRKQQLQSALLQAQGFHGEIEDMQQWLKDTERQLLASKAVGGLPDTAREQLNAHLELCSAFGAKEDLYQELIHKGQQLLSVTPEGTDSNTEHDLANLTEKWETVRAKITDRKVKLEEALTLATDFHNSLQDFINWLTQGEQTLNMISPASLIIETIMFQIDEHKMFITEVNAHREHIIELDKNGTQLKYFSQKQDVVLIKNLLISVQSRWEKLVQRSVERGRLLDDAKKRAKQFHESWNKLMQWLDESERSLDSEVEIANEPDKIKIQLTQHKEYQKALGSKHSVYDTTSRTGRALKDKTSLRDDKQKLDDMLSELRDKWDTVCGKSIERQNKLEEALLFSGQFKDALQALIDWLYRVEPQLAEDQPVHGDIDLVLNLIDNHKVFQKEMGKRTVGVQALKRSARELMESSHDDTSWVKVQMQELSTRWDSVCSLSVSKQARLEQALCQAEEFHSSVHILLEWLAEAEQSLRFHGSLPDDEDALRALIEQHKDFMKRLEDKRVSLNKATAMGEAILSICHPDSITTVKHWNTIIKARFEEVQAWSRQYQQRLTTALNELLATMDLLDKLLMWLQWAETNLCDKDKEILPEEIEDIKHLIAEHQSFMEEMTRKQPDVDIITKTHKRKATMEPHVQSQIPVLERGRTGRKRSPTQTMYTSATQAHIETKNPQVNLLVSKWQHVWLLALDRRRKLNDALDRLEELKEFANFDFDVWRKSYMRWMNHKKSRVMDFFRRMDKDQDGKVTRQEFIEGIVSSKFPTSRLEMSAVADIFDRDGDGYIDYYEFVAALHPNKEAYKPLTDADKIEDEVTRQVAKCKCPKRFQVEQIGANKYRFYLGNQFGDSQQLRLVRILRSTVMVRVGGGWMALDEFLVKNDPCRVHHHGSKMLRSESNSSITQSPIGWQISNFLLLRHEPTCAKGRTNIELREKFILPEGTTQVMASFRYRGRRSRPSSRGASPNRSMSSQSCPAHQPMPVTGTPKTPQQITRNYDKPWLTNSKPSTPLKSSDSPGSSPAESTPVQGSKLRLPGYLSGKGFQSGEEGTLINAAVLKARAQTAGESKKNLSRPGSKAGSRGSSRRGSDASDFDISDIQSVCSDASELVGDSGRAIPRSTHRQQGAKPSKIPTPQKRSTPTSKLANPSKR
ncbi:unnamed protein product [Knipowitschia caucasica]